VGGSKALTVEEQARLDSEIESLTSLFRQWEKESCTVVFEGERNGVFHRTVRINVPDQDRLARMGGAYTAILRKYPEDSNLHTALWKRINDLTADYCRERMLVFTRSDGSWTECSEIRSASSSRDVSAVTTGIPDENGRFSFLGPSKITLHSTTDDRSAQGGKSGKPPKIHRFQHLLEL
jgi:hypothetical protein